MLACFLRILSLFRLKKKKKETWFYGAQRKFRVTIPTCECYWWALLMCLTWPTWDSEPLSVWYPTPHGPRILGVTWTPNSKARVALSTTTSYPPQWGEEKVLNISAQKSVNPASRRGHKYVALQECRSSWCLHLPWPCTGRVQPCALSLMSAGGAGRDPESYSRVLWAPFFGGHTQWYSDYSVLHSGIIAGSAWGTL